MVAIIFTAEGPGLCTGTFGYAPGGNDVDGLEERAPKRQKMEGDEDETVTTVMRVQFAFTSNAPLTFKKTTPKPSRLHNVPLHVRVPDSDQPLALQINIDTKAASGDTTLAELERALQFRPAGMQKAGNGSGAYAAWSECQLAPLGTNRYQLEARVKFRTGIAWRNLLANSRCAHIDQWMMAQVARIPPPTELQQLPWSSPQAFYDTVHTPEPSQRVSQMIQPASMSSALYPFQERAVSWMLKREGVALQDDGRLASVAIDESHLCPSFTPWKDADGRQVFLSTLTLGIMTEQQRQDWNGSPLRGGILAEEMGLGKTVELIALILLHKRRDHLDESFLDDWSAEQVRGSPATLIITPQSIIEQWKSELATHAPSLKVYHYKGLLAEAKSARSRNKGESRETDDDETIRQLLGQDVVLTTYDVLSRELWYAQKTPEKALRHAKRYEQRRSPLVRISWWRVCLDEAQMIESGVSNAATVARQIPRVCSWAVSGTPFKGNVSDLMGLLVFLRYEPFCSSGVWNKIIRDEPQTFEQIFGMLAMRHTKASVRRDLNIPSQQRIVISVPFAAIEEQHYSELFKTMCEEVGVHEDGSPVDGEWDPDASGTVERMRHWLARLRQTCLHPEVGGVNRRALGYRGDGPIRTLDQVLDVMTEQNETAFRTEERAVIMSKLMRGHLQSFGHQSQEGLAIYQDCVAAARTIADECRAQMAQAIKETSKKQAEEKTVHDQAESKPEATNLDSDEEHEDDDDDDAKSPDGKKSRVNMCKLRLRSALELLHICSFFVATGYYQVKADPKLTEENSEAFKKLESEEVAAYEEAKVVRKELLQEASTRTTKLMGQVAQCKKRSFLALPKVPYYDQVGGIEGRKFMETAEMICDLLNDQAAQVEEWRTKLVESLVTSLLDQEGEVELTGEEYEQTTIRQDEQYAYIDALRALIADRITILTGQHNFRHEHEVKEAMRLAKDNRGPAPELMRKLLEARDKLQLREGVSVRGLIADMRSLVTSVKWHAGSTQDRTGQRALAEAQLLEGQLENVQKMFTQQQKAITKLEKELDLFRSTQNARLDFYRQVQYISDAVNPLQEEMSEAVDQVRVDRERTVEKQHQEKLDRLLTRRRYLHHLKVDALGQAERLCIICQGPFETGVLTVCGHQYCKECINHWWNQHRSCPLCKRHLSLRDFHQIVYKPQELRAQQEHHSTPLDDAESPASPSQTGSIYSQVSQQTLDEIKSVDLNGSYGTKIDMIARHLLWIRDHDPGAKSIIFTQYADFVEVLKDALRHFKIGYASIKDKNGVALFKEDPHIECLFLHAKANSSGLNLVNATHVFLCEPLINVAIELQMIARVHRIGQRRQTTVWMYLIRDTVEEAIYEISVARRVSHLRHQSASVRSRSATPFARGVEAEEEHALDAANSAELQGANLSKLVSKGNSGGEVVPKDDLWSCLFGGAPARGQSSASLGLGLDLGLRTEVERHLRVEAAEARSNGNGARCGQGGGTT